MAEPLFAARYRIEERLGAGAMGLVFRAHDVVLDRAVALKLLSATDCDPDAVCDLRREAWTLAQVQHPNVVRVHAFDEDEGSHFIAMELVDGEDLATLLAAENNAVVPFRSIAC